MTLLTAGLFGERNEPPPVPVVDRSVPAAARAYMPKGGTPRRRSYGLPPGDWSTREDRSTYDAWDLQYLAGEKRQRKAAKRVRDALASKRGAVLARKRIEIGAWS